MKETGRQMGESCSGGETFHDNAPYEEAVRNQGLLSTRLRALVSVRNEASIVAPNPSNDTVSIGKTVTVQDALTRDVSTFRIGSYMTLTDETAASYNSPIGRLLMGARIGEIRKGKIAGKERQLLVQEIQ